jgi:hypothetical protein
MSNVTFVATGLKLANPRASCHIVSGAQSILAHRREENVRRCRPGKPRGYH